jgi:hypothetical protein
VGGDPPDGADSGSTGGMIDMGEVYDATSAAIASASASSSKSALWAPDAGGV